jgi:hypothetical protein
MGIQFNIEGPETKKQRELQMQNAELNARILQRSLEKEDPMVRGKQIDESLAIFNDPNSTQGQKSAAWARMNELSGSRMVEGFGQVPLAIPQNEVDRNLYERTEAMANRLEFMNQQIQEAKASGNMARAASLEQARDIQFKSAKENWKKLPIKSAEDLADIKSVIDLGQQALTAVRPDLYGPIDAPLGALGASVGMAPDYTKMNQAFAGVRNQILKARSGGAVTPQEADRFIEEIGTPMAGDFGDRLQLFTVQRKGEYMNKLQALQDAGYEIPDSLKFSTSRVGTQQGAQAPAGQGAGQAGERPRLKFVRDAQGNYVPAQ